LRGRSLPVRGEGGIGEDIGDDDLGVSPCCAAARCPAIVDNRKMLLRASSTGAFRALLTSGSVGEPRSLLSGEGTPESHVTPAPWCGTRGRQH
jgi:hypothetical protein